MQYPRITITPRREPAKAFPGGCHFVYFPLPALALGGRSWGGWVPGQ